jgi:predicted ATPase
VDVDLTISNYRCFSREEPVRIALRPGFIALVGPNNAGKSAVLRFFWELRDLFRRIQAPSPLALNRDGTPQSFSFAGVDIASLFNDAVAGDLVVDIGLPELGGSEGQEVDRVRITVKRDTPTFHVEAWIRGMPVGPGHGWDGGWDPIDSNGDRVADFGPVRAAAGKLAQTFYVGSLRSVQESSTSSDYDAAIGTNLIQRWRTLKTGNAKRDRERATAAVERLRQIFGFSQFDIDVGENHNRLLATIDGSTYGLEELGSGLAHFIVAILNLAAPPEPPSWLLIDEPENGLHPSLQVTFLTSLATYVRDGVLFSTHNYGLARALGTDVYLVRPGESRAHASVSRAHATLSIGAFLGELGYAGYRDLGFDSVLLVEGPSDLATVDELLRILGIRGKSVLLHLGGSSTIRADADRTLAEIRHLTDRVAAVIDSERTSADSRLGLDRTGFIEACVRSGVDCHVLQRRALENYMTDRAVREAFGTEARALQPYESLKEAGWPWAKADTWRIASRLRRDEIADTDLGAFLQEVASRHSTVAPPAP